MPFSRHANILEDKWTEIYEHLFKKAIESSGFGYKCERSKIANGSFTKEIIENLKNADLVIADITGFNGNVMWELGVRHTLSPRTIIVTNEDVEMPKNISDLSVYGVIQYSLKGPKKNIKFNEQVKEVLKKIKNKPNNPDNPVYDYLKIEDLVLKSHHDVIVQNNLYGLMSELLRDIWIADQHLEGESKLTEKFVNFYRFKINAIEQLLVSNYYYDLELMDILHNLTLWIMHANQGLDLILNEFGNKNPAVEKYVKDAKDNITMVKNRLEAAVTKLNSILEKSPNFEKNDVRILLPDKEFDKYLRQDK